MTSTPVWQVAARSARLNPSVIREILKTTERPGVLSLAGGLPAADGFPVDAIRAACDRVLTRTPREALQYAASEGHGPLREWVAAHLRRLGVDSAQAERVLITTGSQQGLDLVGKVLVESDAPLAVERPTYLGAVQAFSPYAPRLVELSGDDHGPTPQALAELPRRAPGTRLAYLQPNFHNPGGWMMPAPRRVELVRAAQTAGVPLVEDDPYGALWFDRAPPPPLAAAWPEGVLYLGSFSKMLAPGLRVGWLLAPAQLWPKLLQAKQAADLHTPGFNQRLVHEVLADGWLESHLSGLRAQGRAQAEALDRALRQHMPAGTHWQRPAGGMFFWLRLPPGTDTLALLPQAVAAGVAYVPGAAFFAARPDPRTLRLSFVTLSPAKIDDAVARLGAVLRAHAGTAPQAGRDASAAAASTIGAR